jgi:hypothetical protein
VSFPAPLPIPTPRRKPLSMGLLCNLLFVIQRHP